MKSKLLLIIFINILCTGLIKAQQNPVPNSGFENWTGTEPDGWFTNNSGVTNTPIVSTNDSYAGSAAVEGSAIQSGATIIPPSLTSTDLSGNGFAVTQAYDYLNFYYKFNPQGSDVFTITIAMIDASGSNFVAAVLTDITASANTYTPMSIDLNPYSGTPVSCIISFTATDATGATATAGTSFKVDKVSLSNTSITGIFESNSKNLMQLTQNTPNPAQSTTSFSYLVKKQSDVKILVSDVSGKIIQTIFDGQKNSGTYQELIDVTQLENGIYFYTVTADGKSETKKLVVLH